MFEIDGSSGEGGGQILRTAVSMAAVTGEPVKVFNIRAGRDKSGLMPQHFSAVQAVADLCGAKVEGLTLGSDKIVFSPGKLRGGKYNVDVGTAGSVTLVLQALMLPAFFAPVKVSLVVQGGTDVKWSPSIDYLRYVFLPLIGKFGCRASVDLSSRGYYPAGGGKVIAEILPSKLKSLELLKSGKIASVKGLSHAHLGLKGAKVAERQVKGAEYAIRNDLLDKGFPGGLAIAQEYVNTPSYGSGITLWAGTENSIIGADALGEKGRRAEDVGIEAGKHLIEDVSSNAALDRYMADQIIPYLALAGGTVSVSEITGHVRSNIGVVNAFGCDVSIKGRRISSSPRPMR
ncbi:MAG: RNA 3'-terminal phosphate cyclase [Candidatus Altiarchaeia archaeon]